MNKFLKTFLIVLLSSLLVTTFSCTPKKKGIDDIRTAFNKKPTASNLSRLKRYYKKKKDLNSLLEIYNVYYKANPKDPYIKEDMGKIYAEVAKTKKGEEKLNLLMKAIDFGYSNDLLSRDLSDLVIEKITAFEKSENSKMLGDFLNKVKKLPLTPDVRTTVLSKIDFLKNKKVFDKFYIPFKEKFEANSDKFIKAIFPKSAVKYDKNKGLFTIQSTVKVRKGSEQAKADAFYLNDNLLIILKFAVEHNKRPPVGKEFAELPFPKEDFKCESAIISKDKKTLTLTCNLAILDLGKAIFAVREDTQGKKDTTKKDTTKKDTTKKDTTKKTEVKKDTK